MCPSGGPSFSGLSCTGLSILSGFLMLAAGSSLLKGAHGGMNLFGPWCCPALHFGHYCFGCSKVMATGSCIHMCVCIYKYTILYYSLVYYTIPQVEVRCGEISHLVLCFLFICCYLYVFLLYRLFFILSFFRERPSLERKK